jgi:hypothetical protein
MSNLKKLFVFYLIFFSSVSLLAVQPENSSKLAVVDSGRLLTMLGQKYKIAALVMDDYRLAIKKIPIVKGQEKATEAKINQTLEEILAFYSTQLIRPLMIEINRLVAEKKFLAIVNKASFKLEEVLLQGTESRTGAAVSRRNPALEQLEKPFGNGVYFSEYQSVEVTDALFPLIEKHLQAAPLVRFSVQGAAKEKKE